MSKLDWKARRNGSIYCAPACGGRCKYADYQKAKKDSAALAKLLGDGWKPRVSENLGWHWSVMNANKRLDVSRTSGSYMAILASQFVGHSEKGPKQAIAAAIKQAKPMLATFRALVEVIEYAST